MQFQIVIPYWGTDARYRRLLEEWLAAYKALALPYPVVIATDYDTPMQAKGVFWKNYSVKEVRADYPFDYKGQLVCAAIMAIHTPLLVLDSDAILQHDPEPLLREFEHKPFAMPADEGALGLKIRNRHAQETNVPKRCAGVLWFGPGADRAHLVREYLRAFEELLSGRYYEERRLFEQHAWSMVAHWTNAPFLPRTLNWCDLNTRNGPNPEAAIYHRIGQRKFSMQR